MDNASFFAGNLKDAFVLRGRIGSFQSKQLFLCQITQVNVDQVPLRLKWGVGRLASDASSHGTISTVLPVFHVGMDDVLPNKRPYTLRTGKNVTICVGEPINIEVGEKCKIEVG